ncbi:MAG TPA: HIT domain-containing protein [Pirellulaceae bacterium]|nr:HIT domain-containing protein [Pirellulaceae bacterium]HMO90702.1 HIT domain-containing protein [Pirellulaceae bacterium]HMP67719.1 HIT domain-containing protein [Pirellulaceae bacterium]
MNTAKFELHPDLKRDAIPIGEFHLSLVMLMNDQAYPWFVLVPMLGGLRDTCDLSEEQHAIFWAESFRFGRGLMNAYQGDKLNVASLGNITPQLHVHHVVRYKRDAAWPAPIWGKHPMKAYERSQIRIVREKLEQADISGLVLFEGIRTNES